jgi:hypothetical protein
MEERMPAQPSRAAPSLTYEEATQLFGAVAADLEDALAGRVRGASTHPTRSGLRQDRAAAWSALTDGQRVSVTDASAGSGKTRVLAEAARA